MVGLPGMRALHGGAARALRDVGQQAEALLKALQGLPLLPADYANAGNKSANRGSGSGVGGNDGGAVQDAMPACSPPELQAEEWRADTQRLVSLTATQ